MRPSRVPLFWAGLALLCCPSGCALERGKGFATLKGATLEIELSTSESIDSPEAPLTTNLGYEVQLERARIWVSHVELRRDLEEDEELGSCDSDHCHASPGEATAAPGEEGPILVRLSYDAPISLLSGTPVSANHYAPSQQLGLSPRSLVLVELSQVEVEGVVTGDELGEVALDLDLPVSTRLIAPLVGPAIDDDGPKRIELATSIHIDGLLDDLDFLSFAGGGGVFVDDPQSELAQTLQRTLDASEVNATSSPAAD